MATDLWLELPQRTVVALQGTVPWVVTGSVTTSPNVNIHDSAGNALNSVSGSLDVNITNVVPVSQSGTWNINNITGTISLPTGAATAANQTNGTQQTQITNGTNIVAVKPSSTSAINTDPALVTTLSPNKPATYSAGLINTTLPTSVFGAAYPLVITGSATKTIRLTRVGLSGVATTAGSHAFAIVRLTAVVGGTPTIVTISPHDINNSTATAIVTAYATGTTPGGLGETILRAWTLFMPTATGDAQCTNLNERYGYGPSQEIILRGTSDYCAITSFNASVPGATINIYLEWTEE